MNNTLLAVWLAYRESLRTLLPNARRRMPDVDPHSLSGCRYCGISFEGSRAIIQGIIEPFVLRRSHSGHGLNASVRRRASGAQRLSRLDKEVTLEIDSSLHSAMNQKTGKMLGKR